MGRQILLFMNETDEVEFVEFIKSTGRISFIPGYMKSRDERWKALPPWSGDRNFKVVLHNEEVSGELFFGYLDGRNSYFVDVSESPVIEYILLTQREDALKEGRLYATFRTYNADADAYVPKAPEFSKWYEKIARWIKKRYTRLEPLTYASPSAMRFKQERGTFKHLGEG